jgi:molybdopterin/thiamine biosynthesis adenylyltransferase
VTRGEGKVVVVGAGGNIGSHAVPHLARMPGVRHVVVIDRDIYEEKNVTSQDIEPSDVGKPKALVQARRLQAINPALEVTVIGDAVENVPLGLLHADVLLAGLDSRAARRTVNFSAIRMGVPWIDSGVNGEQLLARVNVYLPGPGQPCLECGWSEHDYRTLEQSYPCAGDGTPRPTNAPSALGALAASLLVLECQKLLAGHHAELAAGRQVTISARAHRHFVTAFLPNPACRFDHEVWNLVPVAQGPEEMTAGRLFELARASLAERDLRLGVPHQAFATGLACVACGQRTAISLRLAGRLTPAEQTCAACGGRMRPAGSDVVEWLREADLTPAVRDMPLCRLGLRRGDVVSVAGTERTVHFEIGGAG